MPLGELATRDAIASTKEKDFSFAGAVFHLSLDEREIKDEGKGNKQFIGETDEVSNAFSTLPSRIPPEP